MAVPLDADDGQTFAALDQRFDAAITGLISGKGPVSVLFSGGVDSTLVAAAIPPTTPVELVTVRTPRSRDRVPAEEAARWLGRSLRSVEPDATGLRAVLTGEGRPIVGLREPARSVQLALAFGVASCSSPFVLSGQGSDELFGGYAHFRGLTSLEADGRRRTDLERLVDSDWPTSRSIASALGKEIASPFLEDAFRGLALRLPIEPAPPEGLTKRVLRRWAIHRGIPAQISNRPKVALQYGSGVERLLRRMGRGPE